MIVQFRKLKNESSDSWRFVFRVFKRMKVRGLDYESAKMEVLMCSVQRAAQMKVFRARLAEKNAMGFTPKEQEDEPNVEPSVKEKSKVPVDVVSVDGRTTELYRIFILLTRHGYCCTDFGTDTEKFYFFNGMQIRHYRYIQDPVGYASGISSWIEKSRPCTVEMLPSFCMSYDLYLSGSFYELMRDVTEEETLMAYDYREEAEIYFDLLEKGFSARNVGFDAETIYGFERTDDGGTFFKIGKLDQDYEEAVGIIVKEAEPLKGREVFDLFVECYGLESDKFLQVYSFLTGLRGGSFTSVRLYPKFFEVSFNNKTELNSMIFNLDSLLYQINVGDNLSKVDYFRIFSVRSKMEYFSLRLLNQKDVQVEMMFVAHDGSSILLDKICMDNLSFDLGGAKIDIKASGAFEYELYVRYRYSEIAIYSRDFYRRKKQNLCVMKKIEK